MSLTSCMKKAGTSVDPDNKKSILKKARQYRALGSSPDDAGRKALDDQIATVEDLIKTAQNPPKPQPPEKANGPQANQAQPQQAQQQAAPIVAPALLASPSKQEVIAKQDAAEQADKKAKAKAERRAEQERLAKDAERKEIAKASESAADSFTLGGDAMENLTGQGGLQFSRTDTGIVAPMSPNPGATPLYEAMRQLSRFENSFQTATSKAKDLEIIAKEMTEKEGYKGRQFVVEKSSALHQGNRKPTLALKVLLRSGEQVKLLDIFASDTEKPFVVIGNSDAGQNVSGSTAYQMAFAWAHNNGKTMRPDPAGLTVINRLRRTEAMISSAMHYGTTKHLEPHQDQYVAMLDRMKNGGKEPEDTHYSGRPDIYNELETLKAKLWTTKTDAGSIATNVQHLLESSTQLTYSREPATKNFEVVGGELRVRGGREGAISLANLDAAGQVDGKEILGVVLRPASSGVGTSTLRRAAVSGSIMREIGKAGANRDLVARIGDSNGADVAAIKAIRQTLGDPNLSASQGLKGIFYSGAATPSQPSTVARVQAAITELIGGKQLPNQLGRVVVATAADIKTKWQPLISSNVQLDSEGAAGRAQAFYDPPTKTVYLIADNIAQGEEAAVLGHELMHKFGKQVLGEAGWTRLHSTIKTWADAKQGTDERAVYDFAAARVAAVGEQLSTDELFPYAVEGAIKMGIKPSMVAKRGTVAYWLESVLQNMAVVWGKVTGKPEAFKAQDLVDLAFGIAQMENQAHAGVAGFRGTNGAMTNKDVVGNQGGRSADDISPGAGTALPKEMADRGVTMFDGLRTKEGNDIAQAFLKEFNGQPLMTEANDIFGEPEKDRPYYERFRATSFSDLQQRTVAQALESFRDGGSITPSKALFIADLIQLSDAIHDAKGKIYSLMPDGFKNSDVAQEDFGSVSQAANFDPQEAYISGAASKTPELPLSESDPNYSINRIKELDSGKPARYRRKPISSTEIAERFLKDPTALVRQMVELTGFVRDSNEASYSTFIENYSPKLLAEERAKEAKRLTDYLIANASLGKNPNEPTAPNSGGAPMAQTDTPAFKKWFGKSVVTENSKAGGKPMVVYHGTTGDFDSFEKSELGENTGAQSAMAGFFFASQPAVASEYAENARGRAESNALRVVKQVRKRVLNSGLLPLTNEEADRWGYLLDKDFLTQAEKNELQKLDERNEAQSEIEAEAGHQNLYYPPNDGTFSPGYGAQVIPVYLKIKNPLQYDFKGISYREVTYAKLLKDAAENGHDGAILKNTFDSAESTQTDIFIVFSAEQIKSAIGNNGDFDGNNPNIAFARGGNLFQPNIWSTPDTGRMDKFIFEMQDGKVDLRRVQQAITASGQKIEEKWDARLAETLYPGRVAARSDNFLNAEVKPLLEAMARQNLDMPELADYLHARGADERNKQIAKVNPQMPDGGAGTNSKGVLMTTQAARDYLAAVTPARKIVLDAMAKRVDAITAGTRSLLVAEGLEKQETVDAWTAAYKNYVPMFRDEVADGFATHPQGSGFTVKGSATKRAMGSTKEVTNILAHVLMQREAAITRAEKNRVAIALYGQAMSHPNPEFWTTIRPGMQAAQISAELVAMGVDPMTAEVGMGGVPTIQTIDPNTGKVVNRPNPMYKTLPGAITLRINGEDRVLMLNVKHPRGERLAQSLKNLDGLTQLDIAGNFVGKSTRWLASVNTQYNPAFGLVNLTRDVLGGVINLGSTELRGNSLKVLAQTPVAILGIARELATGNQSSKYGKLYRQFVADGGQTGFKENFRDPNERAKAIEKELARAGKLTAGRVAHAVLDLLDGFNTTLENAVRLSAYSAAIDKGMSRPQAARLGRELTVDFNRKGRMGRELGPLYAFFNASVQGTARTLEAIKGPTGAKIIAGGLSLGVMQAMMLLAAGYDDDEVAEFVKTRTLVIPTNWSGTGEKKHILIPYPLGLHVLPNTGRVLTELVLNGGKDIGKRSVAAIGEIAGAFNPLGGGNVLTADGALKTITPTLLDPLIELSANKNFAGSSIEKESYGGEKDNRPGLARAKEATQRSTTGQVYMGISKAINITMGGTDYEAGIASPTPERVRYLAQTVGGGVLRELEKTINASTAKARGEKVNVSQIPVVGRFAGEVDDDQVQKSRYFESGKKLDKLESSFKAMQKAGDGDAAEKYVEQHPELAMVKPFHHIQTVIGKLNRQAVQTIGDTEAIKDIDQSRVDLMRTLNEAVLEMEKDVAKETGKVTLGERIKAAVK